MQYTKRLRQDFSRAAASYDHHAGLQREITQQLAARAALPAAKGRWLDAGCGTGYLARYLPPTEIAWVQVDLAESMCRRAAQSGLPTLVADVHCLPFARHAFDGVFSSLALQWAFDLESCLLELRRVTRPGGFLALSTLLPGTLEELEHCLTTLGESGRLQQFLPQATWEAALIHHGWHILQHDTQRHYLRFHEPRDVLTHLRGLGATHKTNVRPLPPSRLRQALTQYPRQSSGETVASFVVWMALARAV